MLGSVLGAFGAALPLPELYHVNPRHCLVPRVPLRVLQLQHVAGGCEHTSTAPGVSPPNRTTLTTKPSCRFSKSSRGTSDAIALTNSCGRSRNMIRKTPLPS